jgi:hypothetical protein
VIVVASAVVAVAGMVNADNPSSGPAAVTRALPMAVESVIPAAVIRSEIRTYADPVQRQASS